MTTSALSNYPASQAAGDYTGNLGRAFAALIGALLAARPEASVTPKAVKIEAAGTVNLAKLYRLASGRDSLNPALLAELKAISERNPAA